MRRGAGAGCERLGAAYFGCLGDALCCAACVSSPSWLKSPKVFETKDISPDFGWTSYAKSKARLGAGLGFFSGLSISRVSMGIRTVSGSD